MAQKKPLVEKTKVHSSCYNFKKEASWLINKTGPIPLSDKGRLRELLDELSEANLNMEEDVLEDVLTDSSSNTTIH